MSDEPVAPIPLAPWDNQPRIKVEVDVTADDTPDTVAAKVDAALDAAAAQGGNLDDVRFSVKWDKR